MKPVSHWIRALVAVALLLPALANYHRVQAAPPAQDETTAIANAESAAPAVIAKEATIMDWDEDGMPTVVLREGTNGWTCLTDWPVSPGNDPACYDAVFNAWNDAMMAGEEPSLTGPGIAYMLAGGSDPSNTDPFAMEPAAGEDWISTPPHIMIVTSGGFDAADYATEPKQDEPYIMWDGTPYEHLMVPVVPMAVADMGDADADLQNTMSSAPAGIIHKATIKGNPETEGGDMVVLQEGESGWVCYPDRLVSPGNDPSCNDSVWEELFATPEPPEVTRTGVSYMLAGGSDESNTDPMATGPAPGAEWITTPRHIMLLTPGGYDADIFTTDHGSGYPYIMWDGTPYEHLMIPVADMPAMDMDGAPAHAATDDEALRDEIMTAEFTTWDHLIAHDVEATRAEIAEDFIMITADGDRLGREDLLAIVGDIAMTFEEPARDNIVVWRLGPDTAMIVYGIDYKGSYDGDAFAGNEETASIWQMREGRWQNIFLQSTRRANTEAMDTAATDNMSPTVMLPNGFQPEGIAIGRDATAYVSSVGSGAIYKVNLATGEGSIFAAPQETQKALGMVYDDRTDLLYAAGQEAGNGLVYDGLTGELVADVQLTTDANGLVNDVALADDAIFFTDSNLPAVYRLPLDPESRLPDPAASAAISLTGDFEFLPEGINGNGIVASADGGKLIIAHTDLGKLYTVDAATGEATELAVDGEMEIYHDGLVLDGDTLYVVNYNDRVYVVELDPEWTSGKLVQTLTDPKLEAPATAAIYDDMLYVVNARWDAEQTPETEFWLTQVKR